MSAVYKRELKSYFFSPMGYVVIAFLIAIVGLYFTVYNLQNQYPWFGVGLQNTAFVLMIIVPLITMRIMAEERRQKTDQLLYTAPVKITDIVLGKYFAVVTVFAIPLIIFMIYPLILLGFGKPVESLPMDYVAIFGYFLLGAASLAVGFYISTITENQVLAAVLSFALLLLSYYSRDLSRIIPTDSLSSLIGISVLICILAVLIYIMTKNIILTICTALVLEGALLAVFLIKETLIQGMINRIIAVLNMSQRLANFVYGELQIPIVAYYLSVIFLFLFLSIQAIYKRRWS